MSRELAGVENKEANQGDRHCGLIAPLGHTVKLIAILAALGVAGIVLQVHLHSQPSNNVPMAGAWGSHKSFVPTELSLILALWALLYFVWRGIRLKGFKLLDLIGGSWTSGKRISVDLLLAAGIWLVSPFSIMVPAIRFFVSRSPHGYPGNPMLPQNVFEGVLSVLASVSAGFCEEVAYPIRG